MIDAEVLSLLHTKIHVFSCSVSCFGKMNENPQSNIAWERRLEWFKSTLVYIRDVGNIELCELLDMEPKAQCKVCLSYWDVDIVYCTCGHFLRDGTDENKRSSSTLLTSFRFQITTSRKDDTTDTDTGRNRGITCTSSRIRSRRNARREISWVFTTSSSVMRDSVRT